MFKDIGGLLAATFPGLKVGSVAFIGEGMDSKAYMVNHTYVFRFPKRKEVGDNLQKEIVLLPYLQHLPLAVPDFTFVARDPETGWPFVGYTMLKGEEWTPDRYAEQTAGEQQKSLQIIGCFLITLHAFDVELAANLGITETDGLNDYRDTWQELKDNWYPCLSSIHRRKLDDRFNSFFENAALFPASRSLVHNDLSTDHILCDPVSGQPRGIIDFGDIAVGDPDLDLKYLHKEMGPAIIQQLVRQDYYLSNMPECYLLEKLSFYNFYESIIEMMQQQDHDRDSVAAAIRVFLDALNGSPISMR